MSAELTPNLRRRASFLAHRNHPIAAPLDDASVNRLIAELALPGGARVLDLGCGTGEWILRIAGRYDATCLGVDVSQAAIAHAQNEAARRLPGKEIAFRVEDAAAAIQAGERYDLVLCIGSTHAVSGLDALIAALPGMLRPMGQTLIGEGMWERPPTPDIQNMFSSEDSPLRDLGGTVDAMLQSGLVALDAHISEAGEWDRYEWSWTGSLERHLLAHPDDPDAATLRAIAAEHREEYLHGYRGILGFVTCLLALPGEASTAAASLRNR